MAKLNAYERLDFRGSLQVFECDMFLAEYLSIGKRGIDRNEDLVVVQDGTVSVVDGATDKNGKKYSSIDPKEGEITGGRLAAKLIRRVLLQSSSNKDGEALLEEINETFQRIYRSLGIHQIVSIAGNALERFTASMCSAHIIGNELIVTQIGDVSFRINGRKVYENTKFIDEVNAEMRSLAYHLLKNSHPALEQEDLLKHARKVAEWGVEKIRMESPETFRLLGRSGVVFIREKVEKFTAGKLKSLKTRLSEEEINYYSTLAAVTGIRGQGSFQNSADPVFGYAAIDGFPFPRRLIRVYRFSLTQVETIEIFSDGYFGIPSEVSISAWEAAFRKSESEDLHKVRKYKSTKGSTPDIPADDRSVIVVSFKTKISKG